METEGSLPRLQVLRHLFISWPPGKIKMSVIENTTGVSHRKNVKVKEKFTLELATKDQSRGLALFFL
jgi:hypothetical protein